MRLLLIQAQAAGQFENCPSGCGKIVSSFPRSNRIVMKSHFVGELSLCQPLLFSVGLEQISKRKLLMGLHKFLSQMYILLRSSLPTKRRRRVLMVKPVIPTAAKLYKTISTL